MASAFRIGAASVGPAAGSDDSAALRREAGVAVAALAAAGAGLVVLPETFAMPYVAADAPERWRRLAEPLEGPTACWASETARAHGSAIVFGMALEQGGAKPANVALLARPDGSVERLATKIHLPPAAPGDAYGEPDHFEPGPARVVSVQLGPIRLAALVCYDRRIPECWRAAAASGADVVAVLVAGEAPDDPDGLFLAELMTHARANAVYVAAAARTGVETVLPTLVRHSGVTAAVDPDGAVIAAATAASPHVLFDVDPSALARARARKPVLRFGGAPDQRLSI